MRSRLSSLTPTVANTKTKWCCEERTFVYAVAKLALMLRSNEMSRDLIMRSHLYITILTQALYQISISRYFLLFLARSHEISLFLAGSHEFSLDLARSR
jgi:hypothetical protein